MFVSFVIGSVSCEAASDPWQVAVAVHGQIHGAVARGEPAALLGLQGLAVSRAASPEALYASTSKDSRQSTGLTNLGVVDHPALVDDPRVEGVGFTAANHPTGTLFGAAVIGFRGAVRLNFSHVEPCVAAARGAAVADDVMRLLRSLGA